MRGIWRFRHEREVLKGIFKELRIITAQCQTDTYTTHVSDTTIYHLIFTVF